MLLESSTGKSESESEKTFLTDQLLQFTVAPDVAFFCKNDELVGIIDHPYSIVPKSDSNNTGEPNEGEDLELIDKFEVEDVLAQGESYEQSSSTSKSPDAPMNWYEGKLTSSEYVQGFGILFDALSRIKTIKNIGRYFKGEITPSELVVNANEEAIRDIHRLINRVLNYKCKGTRYYISLPVDMYFYTKEGSHFILACKLDESFNDLEMSNIIGPTNFKYGTYVIKEYLEIDGNFSQIPSGAELAIYDYLQIVKRYPNIIEHLSHLMKTDWQFSHHYIDKTEDEMRQLASEHLQRWLEQHPKPDEENSKSQEGIIVLSQETIDSITFVQPVEHVTLEEVRNGTFGTFEELLTRTFDSQQGLQQEQSDPILARRLPSTMQNN